MNRIISKEEEREDIQGEILQSIFEYRIQWCFHIQSFYLQELQDFFEWCFHKESTFNKNYKNYKISSNTVYSTVFPHAILATPRISSTYRINSSPRNITTTRLIPCRITRHLPVTAPCASKHSTRQNKAPGFPTAFQGLHSTSRLPVILPGRNSILHGRQHPRSPYSSSQTHSYRILPGEIGFFPKGSSIVYLCNTKVSVFQFTCSCA